MSRNELLTLFLPDLSGGGAERSILNLAIALAEKDYRVDLALASACGPYLAQVPESVRIVDFKAGQPRSCVGKLARYLQQERPAAMLSALDNANVVAIVAKRLARVPTRSIISIRNTLSLEYQNTTERRLKFQKWCVHRIYPWADAIVSVSHGAADDLAQMIGIPRHRINVIYNPLISPALFEKAQRPVENSWFAPGQPPVVLAAGRLAPQKDYPTLLTAFAKLRAKRPARLVILGEGEERDNLEKRAQELGINADVCLAGFQENPYAYMAKAALFVLSSKFEGMPGVLIQAMACGTPVVSTDCPSGPREALAEGKYGPLVPVGDVDALASIMEKALDGETPRPPKESWEPFLAPRSTDAYLRVMLGK